MGNLTVDLLETFKTEGLPADMVDTSQATAVAKLRCFLRTACRRDWITESLVDKVTAHRAGYEQKEPYSDDEVERILDGALALNGGTHGYARHPKTFRLYRARRIGPLVETFTLFKHRHTLSVCNGAAAGWRA